LSPIFDFLSHAAESNRSSVFFLQKDWILQFPSREEITSPKGKCTKRACN